jgi:hypothetical protein
MRNRVPGCGMRVGGASAQPPESDQRIENTVQVAGLLVTIYAEPGSALAPFVAASTTIRLHRGHSRADRNRLTTMGYWFWRCRRWSAEFPQSRCVRNANWVYD